MVLVVSLTKTSRNGSGYCSICRTNSIHHFAANSQSTANATTPFTGLWISSVSSEKEFIERNEGLRFQDLPKSFYQTNSQQAHRLYQVARDYAGLTGRECSRLIPAPAPSPCLFCTAGCPGRGYRLRRRRSETRASTHAITVSINVSFTVGDLKATLNEAFIEQNGWPDGDPDPPRLVYTKTGRPCCA